MRILKSKQIISALIWAVTILICGAITSDSGVTTLLITAAGIHVVMMTQFTHKKAKNCI